MRGGGRHREEVDVLEDERSDAGGHHLRHGTGDALERGERRQHGGPVGGAGVDTQHGLGDECQRALRADDELGQVVPGGHLHDAAAGADDLARGEHRLEAEDVVTGHAVLHGPHPAGVGGDVAAEGRRVLAGEHGVDEAVGGECLVELGEGDAGLHDDEVVLGVDLEHLGHAVERHHEPTGHWRARAG